MTETDSRPLRVALVDDQPLVRTGFAMVIDSQDDMEVVLQATDGSEAVRELSARSVDVVLMDVRMPRMDGIEATSTLLERLPAERAPKIIVLTTFDLDEYVVAAIRAGAAAARTAPLGASISSLLLETSLEIGRASCRERV